MPGNLKRKGRFLPRGPVSELVTAGMDPEKNHTPLPPEGGEGEQFRYSTKSYHFNHPQLTDFCEENKSETTTAKSVTFARFLTKK
jgi:hypothetical protein